MLPHLAYMSAVVLTGIREAGAQAAPRQTVVNMGRQPTAAPVRTEVDSAPHGIFFDAELVAPEPQNALDNVEEYSEDHALRSLSHNLGNITLPDATPSPDPSPSPGCVEGDESCGSYSCGNECGVRANVSSRPVLCDSKLASSPHSHSDTIAASPAHICSLAAGNSARF